MLTKSRATEDKRPNSEKTEEFCLIHKCKYGIILKNKQENHSKLVYLIEMNTETINWLPSGCKNDLLKEELC